MTRRGFIAAVAGAGALLATGARATRAASPARLTARPAAPRGTIAAGLHPLGLRADRDGVLYVPPSYRAGRGAPLLVLMHGWGGSAAYWKPETLAAFADPAGIVIVAPSSTDVTWELQLNGYGPDVEMVDASLKFAFARVNVDPQRLALGGFSDGASYALSLGLENGTLFTALMAFSPGQCPTSDLEGKPRVYITHGTQDKILPIDESSRVIGARLRKLGYAVTYREFEGDHRVEPGLAAEGMAWLAAGA